LHTTKTWPREPVSPRVQHIVSSAVPVPVASETRIEQTEFPSKPYPGGPEVQEGLGEDEFAASEWRDQMPRLRAHLGCVCALLAAWLVGRVPGD
jgi:hypothetical protein